MTVTNDRYCKTEASVNVPFKNQPSALIIPKKYYYCTGETVTLHGEPDLTNTYTYVWTVCLNGTSQYTTYTTGTVTFPAGNTSRTYTVNMTITNSEGCSAQADPVTITVVAPPTVTASSSPNTESKPTIPKTSHTSNKGDFY